MSPTETTRKPKVLIGEKKSYGSLITIFIPLDPSTRQDVAPLDFQDRDVVYHNLAWRGVAYRHRYNTVPRKIESSLAGLIFQLQRNSHPISSCTVFGNRWARSLQVNGSKTNRGDNCAGNNSPRIPVRSFHLFARESKRLDLICNFSRFTCFFARSLKFKRLSWRCVKRYRHLSNALGFTRCIAQALS